MRFRDLFLCGLLLAGIFATVSATAAPSPGVQWEEEFAADEASEGELSILPSHAVAECNSLPPPGILLPMMGGAVVILAVVGFYAVSLLGTARTVFEK